MNAMFRDPYFTNLLDQQYQSMGKGHAGEDNEHNEDDEDSGDGSEE
jgi:hypothetical protein